MKQISPIGVLVGGVTDIVATNLLSLPVGIYVMIAYGITRLPVAQQQAALVTALHTNVLLYGAMMLAGAGCSILGGYAAAWIAKRNDLVNGALSSFLCVSLTVYAIATGKADEPLWIAIASLPLSPVLGAAGGYFRRARRQRVFETA